MNKNLQFILDIVQQSESLNEERKTSVLKALKDADKELEITAFKLERTEKVKKTTAILLEETIEELEQKRKAVEEQNRELEIESALERVRTVAMGMRQPDDLLTICEVLFAELNTLGFNELRNSMINIFNDDESSFLNYDYSDDAGRTITHHFYNCHPVIENQVKQVRSSNDAFSETVFAGHDLNEWKIYRKEKGEPDDPKVDNISALYYYFYSIGTGAVGISTYNSVSEEKRNVLKRFRNVFDLAYRRFMDIQLAEAQAREAQIEVALERVRSNAMAMKTSEELNALIGKVFTECTKLDLMLDRCIIMIYDTKTLDARWWMANSEAPDQPMNYLVKYHEHLPNLAYIDAWRKRTLKWEYVLEGDVKHEWDEFVFSSTELSQLPEFVKDGMRGLNKIYLNSSFYNFGSLTLSSLEPLSDEHFDILLRVAKVFDLTYTRFNDLQVAEAQNKIIQAENERKTKELEEARQLQLAMLPKELPQLPNLEIAVYMKTATEVGGDYYDFHVQPDGTLTVLLGDATGHGMMSGMMVSIMKSFFISNRTNIELKQFFENSNNSIKDMQLGRLMMPLMGVQITSKKVITANAGMPSLFYFRNKSQKAGEFVLNNMPLGAMKGIKYSLKEINYEKGDTLLLMSDGFAELRNENGEMYSYKRTLKCFREIANKKAEEIVAHLQEKGRRWTNDKEPEDDVTFVVIKLK